MDSNDESDHELGGISAPADITEMKRLKQEDGPNLVAPRQYRNWSMRLLANDLVDPMSIFTVPVVLGGGKNLFADGSAPHSFKLTRSRVSSKWPDRRPLR